MLHSEVTSIPWVFIRPDPDSGGRHYFRNDLRQIAGQESDFNLPWDDNFYLSYPSAEAPNWPAFVAHTQALNANADKYTHYKIVYIFRRAHKAAQDDGIPDRALDSLGKQQCSELATRLKQACQHVGLASPEVIMTSPLTRSLETTELGVMPVWPSARPIVLEGLREKVTGAEKTLRRDKAQVRSAFPAFDIEGVDDVDKLGATYNKGTGVKESPGEVWQRVRGTFAHIFENYPDASVVLLMTHCYVQQAIQREIIGWDMTDEAGKRSCEFFVGEAGGFAMLVKGVKGVKGG